MKILHLGEKGKIALQVSSLISAFLKHLWRTQFSLYCPLPPVEFLYPQSSQPALLTELEIQNNAYSPKLLLADQLLNQSMLLW